MLSFASQKGSLPFLVEFALAELAGVKLTGPLAKIDGLLTAVRTSPRLLHDHKGGQRPVWIHSSSMTDRLPHTRLCKDILKDILKDVFKDIRASNDWLKQSGEERDPVKAKGR
jgi:hypothetical protein